MRDGKFCIVEAVDASGFVLCEVFNRSHSFYQTPCDSRLIGVHLVNRMHIVMKRLPRDEFVTYAIHNPLSLFNSNRSTESVVLSLMHSSF